MLLLGVMGQRSKYSRAMRSCCGLVSPHGKPRLQTNTHALLVLQHKRRKEVSAILQLIIALGGFADIRCSQERELRLIHNSAVPLKNYQKGIYTELSLHYGSRKIGY